MRVQQINQSLEEDKVNNISKCMHVYRSLLLQFFFVHFIYEQ